MKILVIGASGVFGARLARGLVEDGHVLRLAGRRRQALELLAADLRQEIVVLDRDDAAALEAALQHCDMVFDCAGPFQDYSDHSVARAAIKAGCHYGDLSDDAEFTNGITALDDAAREAGVCVVSGLSSVPAISGAVADHLVAGLDQVDLIDTAILPGNRAPRGGSVMQAVLSQAGRPLKLWRDSAWREATGWSDTREVSVPGLGRRPAALIGAPDLTLFPERFEARSVLFRAGLEAPILHHGLSFLAWGRAKGVWDDLEQRTGLLRGLAGLLGWAGTDRGGMLVRVVGRKDGSFLEQIWSLRIGSGNGPNIPALPGRLLARSLQSAPEKMSGAMTGDHALAFAEVEAGLQALGATTEVSERPFEPLFKTALGVEWDAMPELWQDAHGVVDRKYLRGRSEILRGQGVLSRVIGWLFRFPAAAQDCPVSVVMERVGKTEVWTRTFGAHRFRSHLSPATRGHLHERFGPFTFRLALPVERDSMAMPVEAGWFLGVPLPRAMLPRSETREYIEDGRFRFDVRLSAPLAGFIVHYKGWLE